jgi:hypothetical protein
VRDKRREQNTKGEESSGKERRRDKELGRGYLMSCKFL